MLQDNGPILVTGATGSTGSALVRSLRPRVRRCARWSGALRGHLPDWQVDGLLEDYAHHARGEAATVSPVVAELTGRPARDVHTFARDHAAAFGG